MDCALENTGTMQSFIACSVGKQDKDGVSLTHRENGAHHSPCHAAEGLNWEEQSLLTDGSNSLAFLNRWSALLFYGLEQNGEEFQKPEGVRDIQGLSEAWSRGHRQPWCVGGTE